jgi:hypothetical protein
VVDYIIFLVKMPVFFQIKELLFSKLFEISNIFPLILLLHQTVVKALQTEIPYMQAFRSAKLTAVKCRGNIAICYITKTPIRNRNKNSKTAR